jgi:hypothetical protein
VDTPGVSRPRNGGENAPGQILRIFTDSFLQFDSAIIADLPRSFATADLRTANAESELKTDHKKNEFFTLGLLMFIMAKPELSVVPLV